MSGINPQYLLSPPLWEVFTDKDLLTFLNNGYVLFFKDLQRTVGKEVYMISGTPPSYMYVAYGSLQSDGSWRVDLNAQGAFDNALYLFPYDMNGNNENYFIEWYSSTGVLQNSREAWPNLPTSGGTGATIETNLVPNPQFLLHTLTPATDANVVGQVTTNITPFAYGGWTYERTVGSTAIDTITYLRNGSPITNPAANPRYWAVLTCITPGTDAFKRICLNFRDVNKFANSSQQYTFAFNAYAGAPLNAVLQVIQNFGSGGSATIVTTIATLGITTSNAQYQATITFPSTAGNTIGANDDDFMQIVLSVPTNIALSFYTTDYLLTPEVIASPVINDQPDSAYVYQSTAGFLQLPAYDGSDLYLPLVLTPTGIGYDTSGVGSLIATLAQTLSPGYLLCDGSQYETTSSSSDGVPYSRLQSVLYDSTANVPITGTGANFVTSMILTSSTLANITMFTNKIGSVAVPVNGSPSPGFTFTNVNTPITHNLMNAYYGGTNVFYIRNTTPGQTDEPANLSPSPNFLPAYDHNLSFTISILAYGDNVRQQNEVQTVAGSAISAGHYFVFLTPTDSFYVWYKVNGSGSDPGPSGIDHGIQVDILSTYSSADVARITAITINAFQIANILTVLASSIPQSSYWTFQTNPSNNFFVWYNINNGGAVPTVPGFIGIEVDLLSTDTAAIVATKTMIAINSKYFAVPNCQGAVLRGLDPSGKFDPDVLTRYSNNYVVGGALPGTFELDSNQSHNHSIFTYTAPTGGNTPSVLSSLLADVSGDIIPNYDQGGAESRGYNIAVNYIIKY